MQAKTIVTCCTMSTLGQWTTRHVRTWTADARTAWAVPRAKVSTVFDCEHKASLDDSDQHI